MRVVDLTDEHLSEYLCCLEPWSDEMAEAGDHKARWYERMKTRGLRVKLALEDEKPVGMIQYLPIEESIAEGRDLAMVLCIWVHGHDQGVGDRQGHGIGTALLEAAEADAREAGYEGIAAWGVPMPFWMRSSWFKKHGFRSADRQDGRELVWKPFTEHAQAPQWIPSEAPPEPIEGQVTVQAYISGWCPATNVVYERAKRATEAVGGPAVFTSTDTMEHSEMVRHGHTDAVFLDGRNLQQGAPPAYEKIERKIRKRARKLESR